jgi:hypothetical protein
VPAPGVFPLQKEIYGFSLAELVVSSLRQGRSVVPPAGFLGFLVWAR